MKTTATEIQQTWHPHHEGLEQALNDLKRTQIYWALKVANMLFVQSSITGLGQIGNITVQTGNAAKQSAESAQKLQQQAEGLHQMLASFTLQESHEGEKESSLSPQIGFDDVHRG